MARMNRVRRKERISRDVAKDFEKLNPPETKEIDHDKLRNTVCKLYPYSESATEMVLIIELRKAYIAGYKAGFNE